MPFVRKGKAPQKQPAGGKRKNGRKRNFLCAAGCPTGRRAFKKSPPVLGWAAAKKNNQKLWLTPVAGSAASRLPPSASPAVTASASCRRPSSPLRTTMALMTMRNQGQRTMKGHTLRSFVHEARRLCQSRGRGGSSRERRGGIVCMTLRCIYGDGLRCSKKSYCDAVRRVMSRD